jgi:hypothetical protein
MGTEIALGRRVFASPVRLTSTRRELQKYNLAVSNQTREHPAGLEDSPCGLKLY